MDTKKIQALLASYSRSFIVAVSTAYAMGEMNIKNLILAGLVATVGPAIRAINPKDASFGLIADLADTEINKLVKADQKKKATKKKA
jgi:hypothetical protein